MANDKFRFFALVITYMGQFFGARLVAVAKSWIHSLTYKGPTDNPKTVVVVGGSFAGVQLVRRLTETLPTGWRVVLVEKNSHFNFSFNFPRFSVVSGYERQAFIPYSILANKAPKGIVRIVHAQATGLTPNEVLLSGDGDDSKLPYDFLVLATGTSSRPPSKLVHAADREAACKELQELQDRIRVAKTVAVVGGGAVGLEIATDIKTWPSKVQPGNTSFKGTAVEPADKEVTLVHSRDQLMSRFGKRLHEQTLETVQKIGLKVVLGQRPEIILQENGATVSAGGPGKLRYADGHEEEYDCVLVCTGMKYNSDLIKESYPGTIADSGEITVNPKLQVVDDKGSLIPRTFSMGDVARTGGPKMARAAFYQAEVLVPNILSIIKGKQPTKEYHAVPMEAFLKLTLGKDNTIMYMDKSDNDSLLLAQGGSSEDMDIKRGWGLLGAKYDEEFTK